MRQTMAQVGVVLTAGNVEFAMIQTKVLFLLLFAAPNILLAQQGWTPIPATRMLDVCPPNTAEYYYKSHCGSVIGAWGGGALDTLRNRLILWGGGHGDYWGNELYALELDTRRFVRLTDPSAFIAPIGELLCKNVEVLSDGNPGSRHTYGGLAYISHADRLFAYGGSLACGSGGFSTLTWTFDFKTNRWQNMQPTGTSPGPAIIASAYDSNTRKVFVRTAYSFYAYDFDANTWQRLRQDDYIQYFSTSSAVIDPVRRKFVIVGPAGVRTIDLNAGTDYRARLLDTTGPTTILTDGRSPGLAYDVKLDRIVAWDGSDKGSTPDTVYSLDLNKGLWSAYPFPGGPQGGSTRGTFGRWQYVPSLDAFVVVNKVDENAFLFRINSGRVPTLSPTNLTVK